jgi:hypothetical protein
MLRAGKETLTVVDDEPRVTHATQPGRIVPRRGGAGTGRPRKPLRAPRSLQGIVSFWSKAAACRLPLVPLT